MAPPRVLDFYVEKAVPALLISLIFLLYVLREGRDIPHNHSHTSTMNSEQHDCTIYEG